MDNSIEYLKLNCSVLKQRLAVIENILIQQFGGDIFSNGTKIMKMLDRNRAYFGHKGHKRRRSERGTFSTENHHIKVEEHILGLDVNKDNVDSDHDFYAQEHTFSDEDRKSLDGTGPTSEAQKLVDEALEELNKANITCTICGKILVSNYRLRQHLLLHKSDGKFKCDYCESRFRTEVQKKIHMKVHTEKQPYTCKICGQAYRFQSRLKMHLISHEPEKKFSCNECSMKYKFSRQLIAHKRNRHQQLRRYTCTECSKKFFTGTHLRIHLKNVHKISDPVVKMDTCHITPKLPKVRRPRTRVKRRRHPCEVEKQICDICGASVRRVSFKRHLALHEKSISCDECDQSFRTEFSLGVHKRLVHPDANDLRTIPCEHPNCEAKFTDRSIMKCHMKTHLLSPQYFCIPCGKSYKQKQGLRFHNETCHMNPPRRFPCKHCTDEKTFSNISHLRRHVKNVHPDFAYEVIPCPKVRTYEYDQECNGRVKCKYCLGEKTFSNTSHLYRHIRTKHPEIDSKPIQQPPRKHLDQFEEVIIIGNTTFAEEVTQNAILE